MAKKSDLPAPPEGDIPFTGPLPFVGPIQAPKAARPSPAAIKALQAKIAGMQKAPPIASGRESFDSYMTRLGAETGMGGINDLTPEQWQLAQQAEAIRPNPSAQAAARVLNDQERDARLLEELQKIYGIGGKK
jgi:hypothetical protein